jgi:hypothetical protein
MRAALLALVIAGGLTGQLRTAAAERPARVFVIKHGDPSRIAAALRAIGLTAHVNADQRLLVVRAEPRLMSSVEEAVRRLDIPTGSPQDIELTAYVLQGSQRPGPNSDVPAVLQRAVRDLKSAFAYQSFRLLDTMLLRSRNGDTAQGQGFLSFTDTDTVHYEFRVRPSVVRAGSSRSIRVDDILFRTMLPPRYQSSNVTASVDIREGQVTVVGKTGIEGSRRALILIISGRIIE